MTKIFLDAEFTGMHQNTTLISIGLISDCGKTFYAEFNDFDKKQIDEWINKNVIKYLKLNKKTKYKPYSDKVEVYGNKEEIEFCLSHWLQQFDEIEIWSDCLAYDWVLFCELYNGALNIPEQIYYIPFDICTLFKMKGIDPDINREEFAFEGQFFEGNIEKHNAMWDAKIIKMCYNILIGG